MKEIAAHVLGAGGFKVLSVCGCFVCHFILFYGKQSEIQKKGSFRGGKTLDK